MFLLKYILNFVLVSYLSGDPQSDFCPKSEGEIVLIEGTQDLCLFVPILVSNKSVVPLQSRSVYKLSWDSSEKKCQSCDGLR